MWPSPLAIALSLRVFARGKGSDARGPPAAPRRRSPVRPGARFIAEVILGISCFDLSFVRFLSFVDVRCGVLARPCPQAPRGAEYFNFVDGTSLSFLPWFFCDF